MADVIFAVPPIWIPSGTAQRRLVASVQTITFGDNEQGCYLQSLSQNVRVVLDGTSTPTPSGNDLGFVLRSTDPPFLFTGMPGMSIKIIQETATAVVQYQMLQLGGRFK